MDVTKTTRNGSSCKKDDEDDIVAEQRNIFPSPALSSVISQPEFFLLLLPFLIFLFFVVRCRTQVTIYALHEGANNEVEERKITRLQKELKRVHNFLKERRNIGPERNGHTKGSLSLQTGITQLLKMSAPVPSSSLLPKLLIPPFQCQRLSLRVIQQAAAKATARPPYLSFGWLVGQR